MNSVYKAIAIGASAGGVNVLTSIFNQLPQGIQVPIFVVLHQRSDAGDCLLDNLNYHSQLPCIYAHSGEAIKAGVIYIAPPGYHLLVDSDTHLALSDELAVNHSVPSIDLLFESAADVYQEQLIGIVLTGANNDGAFGLSKIKSLGGMAIIQAPDTAEYPVMPQAAISRTHCPKILSPHEIAMNIKEYCYAYSNP